MQTPLRITAQNIQLPAATEALLRKRTAGLERFYPRLIGCEVVIVGPGQRHRTGGPFEVRLRLEVPGEDLVVDRQGAEDLLAVIKDTYDAAVRQLQDHARLRRHEVKHHEERPRGRVVRLFPAEGYGFLTAADGREVYFHRNSVLEPGFEELEVGSEVVFSEEQGHEGPQASTVALAG